MSTVSESNRLSIGMSPSGKAPDFDSGIRRFKSCHPSHFDPLAQLAEQLPFKQWVRSSNLRRITKIQGYPLGYPCILIFAEIRKIKCDADERRPLLLEAAELLFSFAEAKENANESPAGHAQNPKTPSFPFLH